MNVFVKPTYWCKCSNAWHPHEKVRNKDKHGKGSFYQYEVIEYKYCCPEMEQAIENNLIFFGAYDYAKTEKSMNIAVCHPWPEGASWDEMQIYFCPFCRKEIKIIENHPTTKQ